MKARCYNPTHKEYSYYGGRRITVCSQWINSYKTFLKDVGRAPSPKHSIDRIDVNGNYEPSNVRWTTSTVQNINQRINSRNTSGHKGVSWHKGSNKWQAEITVNKERVYLGSFSTKEEAIAARLKAEQQYHQPLLDTF